MGTVGILFYDKYGFEDPRFSLSFPLPLLSPKTFKDELTPFLLESFLLNFNYDGYDAIDLLTGGGCIGGIPYPSSLIFPDGLFLDSLPGRIPNALLFRGFFWLLPCTYSDVVFLSLGAKPSTP